MKCVVCNEEINNEDYSLISEEFKPYPAHKECFDGFETADDFLIFAKLTVEKELEIISESTLDL
jgi:hypothetical protein